MKDQETSAFDKAGEIEKQLASIAFENAGDAIFWITPDARIVNCNRAACKLLGYTKKELLQLSIPDINPEFPAEKWPKLYAEFREQGIIPSYETVHITKEGLIIPVEITANLVELDGEEYNCAFIRDITDRKKIEEALKEREYFFKESQKAAFIGSYKTNFLKGYWESSEVLDQIFGIDKNFDRSIPGWLEIVHPDDREMMNTYLREEVLSKRNPFHKEYRILRKNDAQTRWVLGQGIAVIDEKGNAVSLIGTIQDITERKLDEEKINKLNNAVEASSEVIFMTDLDGIITYMNPAFTTVYGHEAKDVLGKVTPRILKSGVMDDSAYKVFWEEILNKRLVAGELVNKTKDGRLIYIEASNNAVVNDAGTIIGFISIQKDISARKQIEDELVKAKEKAEESDRLKSAFLSNMSHEIRTPMNGILGFAALLKEPTLTSDELQEYIETIQISGERMLNTINSIVDVSKIESGLIELDIAETNINEKIDFLFRFFKPEAENKGLKLSIMKGLSSEEASIKTDSEKVYGVLTNLIKNAVKFTPEGSIEFGYEKKGDFLEFFVCDSGIGIPEEQREHIFERFRQGSESINRGYEGSGLGLSICRSYVEMLGGKIWVGNKKTRGTNFYFTIPCEYNTDDNPEPQESFTEQENNAQVNSIKILIVEDDEISHILLSKRLQKINADLIHANNGIEAIEACKKNPDIDLILMDIRMPVMNGHEATRIIREFNKEVIIIAQTAFALAGDREIAMEAGCNDYLTKPIDKAELLALIEQYIKD